MELRNPRTQEKQRERRSLLKLHAKEVLKVTMRINVGSNACHSLSELFLHSNKRERESCE